MCRPFPFGRSRTSAAPPKGDEVKPATPYWVFDAILFALLALVALVAIGSLMGGSFLIGESR
jgi:hypothetical protein